MGLIKKGSQMKVKDHHYRILYRPLVPSEKGDGIIGSAREVQDADIVIDHDGSIPKDRFGDAMEILEEISALLEWKNRLSSMIEEAIEKLREQPRNQEPDKVADHLERALKILDITH